MFLYVSLIILSFASAQCSSLWMILTSCDDVREACNASVRCSKAGSTFGTFTCSEPRCSGIYCTMPPCTRDLDCSSVVVPANGGKLCERIAQHCADNGYGELTNSSADSAKGGSYSCLRCSSQVVPVIALPQPLYNETDTTDNPALVGGTFGIFIAFAIVLGGGSLAAKKFVLRVDGGFEPRKLSFGYLASLLGAMDEQGNAVTWEYYLRNRHDLLKSCCGDRERMWRLAETRVTIGNFALSFGLSLLFAGLKATEVAITDSCRHTATAGGSYTNALSQSSDYNLDAVDLDFKATVVVIVNMTLIKGGLSQFTSLLFNIKSACLRFFVSFGIELTWGCILLICIEVERNASTITIPGKYLLYFAAAVLALVGDWVTSFVTMYIKWKLGSCLISCCGRGEKSGVIL